MKILGSKSKLLRVMGSPIRILSRARDLYVRSITSCAASVNSSSAGGYPPLPKSFSVGSTRSDSSDDYRDLVRAASVRSMGHPVDPDPRARKTDPIRFGSRARKVPRSSSVGMARIDEEVPSEHGGDDSVKGAKKGLSYPRSRSVVV